MREGKEEGGSCMCGRKECLVYVWEGGSCMCGKEERLVYVWEEGVLGVLCERGVCVFVGRRSAWCMCGRGFVNLCGRGFVWVHVCSVGVVVRGERVEFFLLQFRHQFINNELIVKCGLVDKRKVQTHVYMWTKE